MEALRKREPGDDSFFWMVENLESEHVGYYFRELRYQKLMATVYSFNERSLRMHEKLGFTFEGRLRRTVFTNGRYYDQLYFGMTSEEFDRIDPPPQMWEDTHYGMAVRLTE